MSFLKDARKTFSDVWKKQLLIKGMELSHGGKSEKLARRESSKGARGQYPGN